MEFDVKRAARIDLKRRKQREDAKVDKRSIHEWDEDEDNDFKYNQHRQENQKR